MNLSLAQIATWTGGAFLGEQTSQERIATGYSIDTRTLAPGDLFFAIQGERFDGHTFLDAAFQRGAVAAVIGNARAEEFHQLGTQHPLLGVDDPLAALQTLAAVLRRHWGGRVIGVTGSAGKTTTKDAIAQVLNRRFNVLKSKGNLNNHIGLPLQLMKLQPEHQVAVIEMGMSHTGEIAALAQIAAPNWGVVTNVGNAHAENFPNGIAGIAHAKFELVTALPADGVAFLNADDAFVSQFGRDFHGKSVYFGTGPIVDLRATGIEEAGGNGVRFLAQAGEQSAPVRLQLIGRHNVTNALAAIAVGFEAGISLEESAAALAEMQPGDKRGETMEFAGARIINDCYNSNPEALKSMIHALAATPAARRILVAGEMLELGAGAPEMHRACGREAARVGIDLVIGVRGNGKCIADGATEEGAEALFFETAQKAGDWLRSALKPGDAVLLKASRGVRLEQALEIMTSSE
jgi:UDP-N-acetylmuramoyl-tripeptide--D-alanyl-D-alanine ligase